MKHATERLLLVAVTAVLLASFLGVAVAEQVTFATLEVTPATYTVQEANELFSVDIALRSVADLYGWQFRLGYDSTLSVRHVEINELFAQFNVIQGDEEVLIWGVLLPPANPVSGDIELASITFEASEAKEYAFDLFDTKLGDSANQPIPHAVVDGVPLIIHDIALLNLVSDPSGYVPVPRGDPIYINLTVKNKGNFSETVKLYVFADTDTAQLGDELLVAEATVTIDSEAMTVVNLIWDTTDAPYGSYYISAKADAVPGETCLADNFIAAGSFVGGICHRWEPTGFDTMPLIMSLASSITVLGILALCGIGVFRALGAVW
jgi:hypothetical protein